MLWAILIAAVNGSSLRLTLLAAFIVTRGSIDAWAVLSARPTSQAEGQTLLRAITDSRRELERLSTGGDWLLDEPRHGHLIEIGRLPALAIGQAGGNPAKMWAVPQAEQWA